MRDADDGAGALWQRWHDSDFPLRLGVSGCLLGEEVRFDGGHARNRFVAHTLAHWIEFVSVCPEVEIDMGIPRPTIRLVEEQDGLHLVAPSTGQDYTERMTSYAGGRVGELQAEGLDGFVLKKGSPSCGMERIKVYKNEMPLRKDGRGLFAATLLADWPLLPVEEEGRLNDEHLRENFIERVFYRNRWRALVARGLSRGRLVEFHTAHKLLFLAHDEPGYRRMGQLVASAGQRPDDELYAEYERESQLALQKQATPGAHTNVLQHALGHLKELLTPKEKQELLLAIEDYRQGLLPLIVPLSLVRYEVRRHRIDYLLGQLYFDPHPKELMLRNHA